jgi:NAD(P)-dependent dehydrogenase (short-subunit alcohol dehydrogenase family)
MELVVDGTGITAIVTGAGSGLGAATARALARAGVRVGLMDLPSDALTEMADEVGGLALPCDVTDGPGVEQAFRDLVERFDVPRVLVNCAGIAGVLFVNTRTGAPQSLERFSKIVAVNLVGTFNTIRVFASLLRREPPLAQSERGVIVNVSSIAAFDGLTGGVAYSASKGGVAAMSVPLARELGPLGIRTVAIAPGHFNTALTKQYSPEVGDAILADTAFPNTAGDPANFAKLVLSIVDNIMLNGEVIRLDGGARTRDPKPDRLS